MKKLLSIIFLIAFININHRVYSQTCSGTVANGQNLATNGDFSQGYSGWTHDPAYIEFTPCNGCYSVPGRIYAGTDPHVFNPGGFVSMPDHSPSADNEFLMVDGICQVGINLFSQPNIPIEPNTYYYFTVWITSLKTTGDSTGGNGKLNFNINGQDLPKQINAPANAGQWVKYTAVWYSDVNPPSTATISIQNLTTTGCDTKVDFAIDDISFSPGCEYGGNGPLPNLGDDFSLCGKSLPLTINPNFNAATAASSDLHYKWFKDGVLQPTTTYNYSVTSPGTYAVCVDSANLCPKTDIIVISNTYSIDLGPDLTLCNPITATLDAGYSGPGVTYQWYKNSNAISGATSQTLTVSTPGTYTIEVTDPSCGVKTDDVTVTTNAAIPNDSTFCPTVRNGVTHLSVTGTGKYKWWSAPSGGTALATGDKYTTPSLAAPGPYTYYVEDTSTFALTVGPPSTGGGYSNPTGIGANDSKSRLIFNALNSFRLDSITVLPYNYYCPDAASGNHNIINIIITDANGVTVGTSSYNAQCNGSGQPAGPLKVPVGINIPQGNGYTMKLNTGSTQIALYLNPGTFAYPTTYSSLVEFASNSSSDFNPFYSPNALPGYFNWKVTKGINCQRVPVVATMNCVCTTSTPVTSVHVDSAKYCVGAISTITLSATGGSGDTLAWYSGSCGGNGAILVGKNHDGSPITITAPTSQTTYFARWESPLCNSSCLSLTVTPVSSPTAANAGLPQKICNSTSVTLSGNTPVIGTGTWSVVSGMGATIVNANNPSTQVNLSSAGSVDLKWTISNSPCPSSSSTVTITRDTLTSPVISGTTFSPCASTSGATFTTTVNNALTKYSWSASGTLVITSATNINPVTVDIGSTGGTLTVTDTNGSCVLSASQLITPVQPPVTSVAGTNQNICNLTTATLAGNTPAPVGATGTWSIVSGTGNITNIHSPSSTITGLQSGDVVLKWTLSNSPCADSSSQVTIHRDTLVAPILSLTGASYDTCALTTGVTYSTTVDNSSTDNYVWSKTGTLVINSNSANSAIVDIGASGGTLTVTESSGACSLSASKDITITPNIAQPSAGPDQIVCIDQTTLSASSGNGKWTVTSGTGTFEDDTDFTTNVTGLSTGANTFTWTAYGCGGPLHDDIVVTLIPSNLALDPITGPTDTLCVGTARALDVKATGGSGQYAYIWLSSDSTVKSVSDHGSISVTPSIHKTTYTVYAVDKVNLGCISPSDSIDVYAISKQNLYINNLLTPNDDHLNDKFILRDKITFQPILPGSKLEIFNQWGSRVFQSNSYDNSWGAKDLTDGVYYYNLKTGCGHDIYKGWLQIIR